MIEILIALLHCRFDAIRKMEMYIVPTYLNLNISKFRLTETERNIAESFISEKYSIYQSSHWIDSDNDPFSLFENKNDIQFILNEINSNRKYGQNIDLFSFYYNNQNSFLKW